MRTKCLVVPVQRTLSTRRPLVVGTLAFTRLRRVVKVVKVVMRGVMTVVWIFTFDFVDCFLEDTFALFFT